MELRDNNTRKLTSGLRRPFGVAGNPRLLFPRGFRPSPSPGAGLLWSLHFVSVSVAEKKVGRPPCGWRLVLVPLGGRPGSRGWIARPVSQRRFSRADPEPHAQPGGTPAPGGGQAFWSCWWVCRGADSPRAAHRPRRTRFPLHSGRFGLCAWAPLFSCRTTNQEKGGTG